MSVEASTPTCEICGGKGYAQIVLQAGPNPQVSPPLDCLIGNYGNASCPEDGIVESGMGAE